jgi:hypothetical protein
MVASHPATVDEDNSYGEATHSTAVRLARSNQVQDAHYTVAPRRVDLGAFGSPELGRQNVHPLSADELFDSLFESFLHERTDYRRPRTARGRRAYSAFESIRWQGMAQLRCDPKPLAPHMLVFALI